MDLKEVCCDARNWMDLAQDGQDQWRTNGNEPPGSLKANYIVDSDLT